MTSKATEPDTPNTMHLALAVVADSFHPLAHVGTRSHGGVICLTFPEPAGITNTLRLESQGRGLISFPNA